MNIAYKAQCKKQYEDLKKVRYVYRIEMAEKYRIEAVEEVAEETAEETGETQGSTDAQAEKAVEKYDGEILIDKECLHIGEVRSKVIVNAQGKREIVQSRVIQTPRIKKYVADKSVVILNVAEYDFYNNSEAEIPYFAGILLNEIFVHYQGKGQLPLGLEFSRDD